MTTYDVQIDVESRKLAPHTDPLKRPKNRKCIYKNRKCIYGASIKALFTCAFARVIFTMVRPVQT
jgi:hypothetical protein